MLPLMFGLLCAFVISIFWFIRQVVLEYENQITADVLGLHNKYQELIKRKEELIEKRHKLEEQKTEIFMLYEITKEITKAKTEDEAFQIFKDEVQDKFHLGHCRFFHKACLSKKPEQGAFFSLKSKKKELGYLLFTELPPETEEKAAVVVNQFALVLTRLNLYKEVEELATVDSLTGLFGRKHLLDLLQEEMKRALTHDIEFSLLLMDVDHFKKINDRYGHFAGDRVLRNIAKVIRSNIREIDIAGRYGGEEFCVVLPDTDIDGAFFAAERIRGAVETSSIAVYEDVFINVTVSIGIVNFPQHGRTKEELIDKADWALYRAKKNGRNQICLFGMYA